MLYSIGHGNKKIRDFIEELKSFGVKYLIDVRSKPFSKFNPQFNQEELRLSLAEERIRYVFLGSQLGGLPDDKTCYNKLGKVDYSILKNKPSFISGLQRLLNANKQNVQVAIMCSESKPHMCHRSKLIGRELQIRNVEVQHIIGRRQVKDQSTVLLEATNGKGSNTLFDKDADLTSQHTYPYGT